MASRPFTRSRKLLIVKRAEPVESDPAKDGEGSKNKCEIVPPSPETSQEVPSDKDNSPTIDLSEEWKYFESVQQAMEEKKRKKIPRIKIIPTPEKMKITLKLNPIIPPPNFTGDSDSGIQTE